MSQSWEQESPEPQAAQPAAPASENAAGEGVSPAEASAENAPAEETAATAPVAEDAPQETGAEAATPDAAGAEDAATEDEAAAASDAAQEGATAEEEASDAEEGQPSAEQPPAETAEEPEAAPASRKPPAIQEERKFPPPTGKKRWYVVKVQTNREDTVKQAILRRVQLHGLEDLFGEILVPTETTVEYKGGKKRYKKQKLYPGYIIINMEVTDESWFLVRETPGVGDFTGAAGNPVPMEEEEIEQLLARIRPPQREEGKAKQVINVKVGDRVKIKEGTFLNFEGEVEAVDEATGRVTVMINIFGRSTPVEMKHYQLEVL